MFTNREKFVSTKHLLTTKSLPSAKSLTFTKSLPFTKFIVIYRHLIDESLSNITKIPSSNDFGLMKINYSQVVIFSKTKINQRYLKASYL